MMETLQIKHSYEDDLLAVLQILFHKSKKGDN